MTALWIERELHEHEAPASVLPIEQGQEIFFGKGRCGICHTLGAVHDSKCPNLGNAGDRLTREFIYEAITEPQAYVRMDYDPPQPEPYPTHMPQINKPPIGLTAMEIEQVIQFVQSQKRVEIVR